jgi:hypothetical protein
LQKISEFESAAKKPPHFAAGTSTEHVTGLLLNILAILQSFAYFCENQNVSKKQSRDMCLSQTMAHTV